MQKVHSRTYPSVCDKVRRFSANENCWQLAVLDSCGTAVLATNASMFSRVRLVGAYHDALLGTKPLALLQLSRKTLFFFRVFSPGGLALFLRTPSVVPFSDECSFQ